MRLVLLAALLTLASILTAGVTLLYEFLPWYGFVAAAVLWPILAILVIVEIRDENQT